MSDYSKKGRLEEHTETHLDLLLKIASLQEKGLQDETQNLELMKALTAKKMYEALQENCSPERFLNRVFEAAEALKLFAEKLSPKSNNDLLSATFTPRRTTLKSYNIPKNLVPSSERTSPTVSWHNSNFPAPFHKEIFTIGCQCA